VVTLNKAKTTKTLGTLGLKTLGFFVFRKGKMIERDQRKIREAEFTKQHTLNNEQFKKLLDAKINRARQYNEAEKKRRQHCEE
jgi:hypothetical protein